jgi:hypothetical protein
VQIAIGFGHVGVGGVHVANRDLERYRDKERARSNKLAAGRRWYARNAKTKLAKVCEKRKTDPRYAAMLRGSVKRHRDENRVKIERLKVAPCLDCNECFPPECMDFDHRDPKTKRMNIAALIGCRLDKILAEIAKCDLICANCHRIRTRRRRQGVTRKPVNVEERLAEMKKVH